MSLISYLLIAIYLSKYAIFNLVCFLLYRKILKTWSCLKNTIDSTHHPLEILLRILKKGYA